VRRCVQANAFTASFSCVETRRVHRARGAEGEACNALFEVVSMESDAAAAAAAAVAVPAAKAGSDANNIYLHYHASTRPIPGLATPHTTSLSYRQYRQRD